MFNLDFLYDDRPHVPANIASIVGDRRYGAIVYKRRSLSEHVQYALRGVEAHINFQHITNDKQLHTALEHAGNENRMVYFHPASVIPKPEAFALMLNKALRAKRDILHWADTTTGLLAENAGKLATHLKHEGDPRDDQSLLVVDAAHACQDLSDYQNCLSFFSGGFEARFFNQVANDADFVIKQSTNIAKIRAEHDFYYMLPHAFQRWFVQPFDLRQDGNKAHYRMERLMMPDMALQWIHGAMPRKKFTIFLDRIMAFLRERPTKPVSRDVIKQSRDAAYSVKLRQRMQTLKAHPAYEKLNAFIQHGTAWGGIDDMVNAYFTLYDTYEKKAQKDTNLVIGHGDLCFSNILYDKHTNFMRLIDPKGAATEDQMWGDGAYDLAKLSHSILGDYDWINNDLFSVRIGSENRLQLKIDSGHLDLSSHKEMFAEALAEAGYDICGVRLCEASLFLSMLPLHMDHEQKVLAFLLRAGSILDELKYNG